MGWSEWEQDPEIELKELMYQTKYRDSGGAVCRILFNRPEKMNAMTAVGWQELIDCMTHANQDKDVAVIVLGSVGDHFGVGGSLDLARDGEFSPIPKFDNAVKESRRPVIAAVKGYCIGGHHHLAYHCDFTIAADTAIFGQNGPRVGSPAHGRVVASLAYVVGIKRAKEIWMLCRRYTPQQALQMGLINTVVPLARLDEEVDKWCEELMGLVPGSISMIKASFEAVDNSLKDTDFAVLQDINPEFRDFAEAFTAFAEKREPQFWNHAKKKE